MHYEMAKARKDRRRRQSTVSFANGHRLVRSAHVQILK